MAIQTLKVQKVVDTIKTWSPTEQLELIQAITKHLQGLYALKASKFLQQIEPFLDSERDSWLQFSQSGLESAYGEDEPEYTLNMLRII